MSRKLLEMWAENAVQAIAEENLDLQEEVRLPEGTHEVFSMNGEPIEIEVGEDTYESILRNWALVSHTLI